MNKDDIRQTLLYPVSCDQCVAKNRIDSSLAGKKALENAPFCPECATAVYQHVLDSQ